MFKFRISARPAPGGRRYNPPMLSAAADPWINVVGVFFALQLPAWLVVGLWLWRRQENARARRDRTHCGRCGYSLTGNESGVCPECGTSTLPRMRR